MSDKLMEDPEITTLRLSCDCLDPMHTVDLSVERIYPREKSDGYSTLIEWAEKYRFVGLWQRVVNAVKMLLGRELWGHGFIVRNEDVPAVLDLLRTTLPQGVTTTGTSGDIQWVTNVALPPPFGGISA